MSAEAPHPAATLRKLFSDLLVFFATTYRDVFGLVDGPPLHDPIAIAVLLDETGLAFDDHGGERWNVDVVTNGQHSDKDEERGQLGRTIISKAEGNGIRIPRSMQVERFWELLQDALTTAETMLGDKAMGP